MRILRSQRDFNLSQSFGVVIILMFLSVSTPAHADELTIAEGEIRLDGKVSAVNLEAKSFVLDVAAFTLPTGKTKAVAPAKAKTITLQDKTIFQKLDAAAAAPTDLKT